MIIHVKTRGYGGVEYYKKLNVNCNTFETFKTQFPKHFGNIVEKGSNKARNQKALVRKIISESDNFEEMSNRLKKETIWEIKTHKQWCGNK